MTSESCCRDILNDLLRPHTTDMVRIFTLWDNGAYDEAKRLARRLSNNADVAAMNKWVMSGYAAENKRTAPVYDFKSCLMVSLYEFTDCNFNACMSHLSRAQRLMGGNL